MILLFPGSFKPFHDGHFSLIKRYIKELSPERVYLIISSKKRAGIPASVSKNFIKKVFNGIWDDIEFDIKEKKKKINPINYCYKIIGNDKEENQYAMINSDKDSDNRVADFYELFKKGGDYYHDGAYAVDPEIETEPVYYSDRNDEFSDSPISSAIVRNDIVNDDFESFKLSYNDILNETSVSIEDLEDYFEDLSEDIEQTEEDIDKLTGYLKESISGLNKALIDWDTDSTVEDTGILKVKDIADKFDEDINVAPIKLIKETFKNCKTTYDIKIGYTCEKWLSNKNSYGDEIGRYLYYKPTRNFGFVDWELWKKCIYKNNPYLKELIEIQQKYDIENGGEGKYIFDLTPPGVDHVFDWILHWLLCKCTITKKDLTVPNDAYYQFVKFKERPCKPNIDKLIKAYNKVTDDLFEWDIPRPHRSPWGGRPGCIDLIAPITDKNDFWDIRKNWKGYGPSNAYGDERSWGGPPLYWLHIKGFWEGNYGREEPWFNIHNTPDNPYDKTY